MNKKSLILSTIVFLTILVFFPGYNVNASGSNYTYRSTVIGRGINHTSGNAYEVTGASSNLNCNDSVFVMSRIFNIKNVDSFQFKHEVYSKNSWNYRELYSPTYWPNGQWWSETYSWNDFGRMADGEYELRVYLSVNGGDFRQLDNKSFSVNCGYNNYYDNSDYNYNNNSDYYYNNNNYNSEDNYKGTNYDYNWTNLGTNVRRSGNNYEMLNSKLEFKGDEQVYALSKFSNIDNIDTFQIKQELYTNGTRLYKTNESGVQHPNNNYQGSFYYSSSFGKLPSGYHELRVYVRINGGRYVKIDNKQISVNRTKNAYFDYHYEWSNMDNNVDHINGYVYGMDNPRTNFNTNENVVVLTKLSNIKSIDRFRIKHELYREGSSNYIKYKEAAIQYPHGMNWEYNYSWNDFGKLDSGNYTVKVYLSINDGSYRYLDTKYISVSDYNSNYINYCYNDNCNQNYQYEWTQTSTGYPNYQNPYYYNPYY